MEDDIDTLSAIESRHKKEKKDVQAKIQALKKAARNDKSKKKDLFAEVARLEFEVEQRHKHEIECAQTAMAVNHQTEIEDLSETERLKAKISKAQKRRDKKSQQEKEREEQIKQQEKDNIHGPRNIEIQAISAKLKEKNLKIFHVLSDGDCLYKAIAHQLEVKKNQKLTVDVLRRNVSNYIRNNKDDFIPFMSNPDTCDILSEADFQEYCDKIMDTKVWGGQIEIRALSSSLKCPINVIQASGPECIEQGAEFDSPPLVITYHRHMYSLGEHYNSTCVIDAANS